jgi:DNA-binding winged helix-turn-helix (wHTH) protein/TolB-like protein
MLTGRVRFGSFQADLGSGELWRDGVAVPIQDLPFRLLSALVERPGEVVTRAELTARLWGSETFVDAAAGLNTAVAKLREALDDDAEQPRFIETVPKRGYRFIGAVEAIAPTAANGAANDESPPAAHVSTRRRWLVGIGAALATISVVAIAAFQLRANRAQVRVAVVLFDNETGKPELGRLAQGLTDATVTALAADTRLAVIGNAAVLRTARPFRDIALVRDALNADFIVIGQVQSRDADTIVRAHLIRAKDQAHVWVAATPMTEAGEAALQSAVSARIASAVTQHAR